MTHNTAVILGMSITGLAVARNLGRQGIRVISVDYNNPGETFWSRYAEKLMLPESMTPNDIAQYMVALGRSFSGKPVLYADRDEHVLLISNHREALNKYYQICLPSNDLIDLINNKFKLMTVAGSYGLSTPETILFEGKKTNRAIEEWQLFPAIIKPLYGYLVYTTAGFKTILVGGKTELKHAVMSRCGDGITFLLQEMIPGNDNEVCGIGVYLNRQFEPLGVSSFRKMRQSPEGHGIGVLVRAEVITETEKNVISFLREINYTGLAEAEFKRDPRDGTYKLIEINTRPWLQMELASRSACNLALTSFQDLTGTADRVQERICRDKEMYWVFEIPYLTHVFRDAKYRSLNCTKVKNIFKIVLRRKVCFAVFAFDDPKAFLYYYLRWLFGLIRKNARSLWNLIKLYALSMSTR